MLIAMSEKEISRFKVIQDVCEHRLRRTDAAEILCLSVRHIQRLMNHQGFLVSTSLSKCNIFRLCNQNLEGLSLVICSSKTGHRIKRHIVF
ncbi:hypothetical protein ACED59_12340, partial [Vibrio sp. FF266]